METQRFKKYKTETGGTMIEGPGMYPSISEERANSFNSEKTAGRACSVIPGTVCEGMIQGTFIEKFEECRSCEFYQKVKEEEESNFIPAVAALKKPE